jgi:Transporter associated domain
MDGVVHLRDLTDGSYPIHDLPDIGMDLPEDGDRDYTTIAGLLLAHLGHISTKPGETVDVGGATPPKSPSPRDGPSRGCDRDRGQVATPAGGSQPAPATSI